MTRAVVLEIMVEQTDKQTHTETTITLLHMRGLTSNRVNYSRFNPPPDHFLTFFSTHNAWYQHLSVYF